MTPLEERKRNTRLENLGRANRVRLERSNWKQVVSELPERDAYNALIHLVEQIPDWALTWKLSEAMRPINGLGRVRVHYFFVDQGLAPEVRIGSLTERQKNLVTTWARGRRDRKRWG
ncbi:MAG TPA: hypothetical protein VJP59_03390 [Gemmatimonadota bacterium]|nr:hypothetical protein [Gemmatimonadota bacterium]